jgi:hypothetical protein
VTVTEASPLRTRTIVVPRLTVSDRVAEIESLAHAKDLTRYQMWVTLRSVAHGSLWGSALWAAWMRAEAAIAVRDETDEDDGDYPGYADEAEAAIEALIYGMHAPRTGDGAA